MPLQHRFSKLLKTFEPCIATCHGLCAVIYFTGKALATKQFNAAFSRSLHNVLHSMFYSHCNCAVQQFIHYKEPGTANQVCVGIGMVAQTLIKSDCMSGCMSGCKVGVANNKHVMNKQ